MVICLGNGRLGVVRRVQHAQFYVTLQFVLCVEVGAALGAHVLVLLQFRGVRGEGDSTAAAEVLFRGGGGGPGPRPRGGGCRRGGGSGAAVPVTSPAAAAHAADQQFVDVAGTLVAPQVLATGK